MEAMNHRAGRILCATDLSNKSGNTYRIAIQKRTKKPVFQLSYKLSADHIEFGILRKVISKYF